MTTHPITALSATTALSVTGSVQILGSATLSASTTTISTGSLTISALPALSATTAALISGNIISYSQAVLDSSPLFYLRLADLDTSLAAADSSGFNVSGTYTGNPQPNIPALIAATGTTTPDSNRSVRFTGTQTVSHAATSSTGTYPLVHPSTTTYPGSTLQSGLFPATSTFPATVTFPSEAVATVSALTLDMWFRTTSTSPSTLISTGQFTVSLDGSGFLVYTHKLLNGTSSVLYRSPTRYNDDRPHYLAVVTTGYPSGEMRLYANDSLIGTSGYGSSATSTTGITFGSEFVGILDEIACYSTILTSDTISRHYLAGKGVSSALPVTIPGSATLSATPSCTATALTRPLVRGVAFMAARTAISAGYQGLKVGRVEMSVAQNLVTQPTVNILAASTLSGTTALKAASPTIHIGIITMSWSPVLALLGGPLPYPPPAAPPAPTRSPLTDPEVIDLAVNASHISITKAEVLDAKGTLIALLPILDGEVTIDVDNSVRRSCSFTLVDVAKAYDAFTSPGAYEVRISRGVADQGFDYYVSLGVFGISEDSLQANTSEITVNASDRSRKVSRAKLIDYYVVGSGTNYATAIQALINSRVPNLTYNFATTATTAPLLVFSPQDDPWQKASEMAASIGMDLYFDREGVCVLRATPDLATAPLAAKYLEGLSATFLNATRHRSSTNSFNHIIVVGAASGSVAPVLAEAVDNDPASPTYIGSPRGSSTFGDVPKWITSGYITSLSQAQTMADAELKKVLGLIEQVTLSAVVNPVLSAGDVVSIASTSARLDARYLIESLTIPLSPSGSMSATMRQRKITS